MHAFTHDLGGFVGLKTRQVKCKHFEGCCQCKNREFKIYSDLQEFLECKLNTMKESFLNIISEYNKNVQNDKIIDAINIKSSEYKNDIINTLSSIIKVIAEKTEKPHQFGRVFAGKKPNT